MAKIPAVLIFGAPGSGKGTVGAKLAATTSLKHISTGDIFRGIAPSSESGKLLASYSSKGLVQRIRQAPRFLFQQGPLGSG